LHYQNDPDTTKSPTFRVRNCYKPQDHQLEFESRIFN